ncbi:MAG: BrnT family toxin [Candidatus Vogelbacteria bacterium]|nr:BrnT family toxin [Candidatus Vogelbacteria bacterium]
MTIWPEPEKFEWDQGNQGKHFKAHGVSDEECEEVFFDSRKRLAQDILHSGHEARYLLIGMTKKARLLFIAFTVRNSKIRIISGRDLNKKERKLYGKEN